MKTVSTAALTVCCLIVLLAGRAGGEESRRLILDADTVEYRLDCGDIEAAGAAEMQYGDVRLSAGRIVYHRHRSLITAEDGVEIFHEGRQLKGRRLEYDTAAGSVVVEDGHGQVERIYFSGSRLEASQQEVRMLDGAFTTCDHARPHYRLTAKSIELHQNGRVRMRNVSVWLGEYRVFFFPYLSHRMGEDSLPLLPGVSYDNYYGLHVSMPYRQELEPDTILSGSVMLGRRTGVALKLERSLPSYNFSIVLDSNRTVPDEPDYRISYAPNIAVRTTARPIGPLYVAGNMEVGSISENPSGVHTTRSVLGVTARSADFLPCDKQAGGYFFEASQSWYGTGSSYSVVGGGVKYEYNSDRDTGWDMAWRHLFLSGETPFVFDRVRVNHALEAGIKQRLSSEMSGSVRVIYDIERGRIWDTELSVGRTFHCIEVRGTWQQRSGGLGIQVGLAAF